MKVVEEQLVGGLRNVDMIHSSPQTSISPYSSFCQSQPPKHIIRLLKGYLTIKMTKPENKTSPRHANVTMDEHCQCKMLSTFG